MRRVVVTGLGVVSPVGSGLAAFWRNLTAGRSGVGPITLFDVQTFPVRIGGQVRDLGLVGRRAVEDAPGDDVEEGVDLGGGAGLAGALGGRGRQVAGGLGEDAQVAGIVGGRGPAGGVGVEPAVGGVLPEAEHGEVAGRGHGGTSVGRDT